MTRRTHGIMMAAVLSVLCASAAGCSSTRTAVTPPPEHVIAWNGAVPSQLQPPRVPPSADCVASRLRVVGPGFQFVAGPAGGIAAVALRNVGPGRCRLTGACRARPGRRNRRYRPRRCGSPSGKDSAAWT